MMMPHVVERIKQDYPSYKGEAICENCHNNYVVQTLQDDLEAEMDTLSELEQNVIACLREQTTLATNVDEEFDRERTTDEVIADGVVGLVGSWRFVGIVAALVAIWICLHITIDLGTPFDLHPLILMNIVLACWAAIQGPIILLSQNRQKARDRKRAAHDYQVNLKAEFEVRYLHAKIDLMVARQQRRLLDIQQAQMQMIEQLMQRSE
jgi:uncharacterized membrane protein